MLSAQADWFLCGVAESDSGRAVVRVDRMPFVIGRRPGLNLTLDSLCVSGRHAELSARGERLFVADLGSRNGTQVNGKRVRSSPLGVGDLLKVGDVEFRLDRRPRVDTRGRAAPAPADLDTLQVEWFGSQFDELLSGAALTAELRPIVQLCDETVAAYEARGQSQLAGLETEAKMCEAARMLGREKELNQLLLHCCESVVGNLPAGCWLLLRPPAAVNLASEVVPVLQVLRARAPQARIVVEVLDAPLRSLRSLNDFVADLKSLDVQLALGNFAWEHMRFLQSSRLLPLAVRLDAGLTQNLAQKSEPERKRLRTMVGSLHQYRIRSIATGIETPEDARACDSLEIDFAVGPLFDESMSVPAQPLLETCVLAESVLSALNEAPALLPGPDPDLFSESEAEPPIDEAPAEDWSALPEDLDSPEQITLAEVLDLSAGLSLPDELGPPEELALPEDLDFPDQIPGASNASVLEDENDITAEVAVDFGSTSFRLPPPRRS
jgi:EAL domain-containing protein (putative c-di-GMP-specific phosphodiesterase class I)